MQKDEVMVLAHLLTSMKEAAFELKDAIQKKDSEKILIVKREIIKLNEKVKELL